MSWEMPEYVRGIGFGVNEWECERCSRGWAGWKAEEAATHQCE